jgi:AcrR family transcriptional regulator
MKTKRLIVHAAIELFSKKGFTETGVREIAAAVGVNESSLYNHFDSKSAILQYILEQYRQAVSRYKAPSNVLARLTMDATPDDIMACLTIYFPPEEEPFFQKILQVLFQEQFRNEAVRKYITNDIILWNERYVSSLLQQLVATGALDDNTDIDYWAKLHVALSYKFSASTTIKIDSGFKKHTLLFFWNIDIHQITGE